MPQPNEHHTKLLELVGSWIGEEMLSPSPSGPGGAALGRFTMKADVDGFFVLQDYIEEKDGRTIYRGHGIFGWDEQHKNYAWYWVDSMGSVPASPSRGHWEGSALTFEHTPVGDQRGRYTYTFLAADRLRFEIENSRDGGKTWTKLMEGVYRRQ